MGLLMICFWSLLLLSQISCFWEVLGLFCFDLCVYKMLSSVSIYGYNGSWIFFLYNSRVRTSVLSSWIFRPLALVLFGPLTLRMSSTIGGCSLFTNELNCLPSTWVICKIQTKIAVFNVGNWTLWSNDDHCFSWEWDENEISWPSSISFVLSPPHRCPKYRIYSSPLLLLCSLFSRGRNLLGLAYPFVFGLVSF